MENRISAEELAKILSENQPGGFQAVDLQLIQGFSTHFCEWDLKEDDIILHVFPRAGRGDTWQEGRYLPQCRACGNRVEANIRAKCPRCGKVGLRYVPGRLEDKPNIQFPADMVSKIARAVDAVWLGSVAIEKIPELEAYVVQLQGAGRSFDLDSVIPMVDKFCETLDHQLDAG